MVGAVNRCLRILPLSWRTKSRLLPEWVPFHPSKWWVTTRYVYCPTSYLYVNKCQMPLNPLLENIREEIYVQSFSTIRFEDHSSTVAAADLKVRPSMVLKFANPLLRIWDAYLRPAWLHGKIQNTLRDQTRRHDENTAYSDLTVVDQSLTMVMLYFDQGEEGISLSKHREVVSNFLWQGADGMTASGTDGIQVWDTAFSVLAVVEAGLAQDPRFREMMLKALGFLEKQQLREDLDDPYRQPRKGGWTFSTKANGFVVPDCSGEALKAVLLLQEEW